MVCHYYEYFTFDEFLLHTFIFSEVNTQIFVIKINFVHQGTLQKAQKPTPSFALTKNALGLIANFKTIIYS